MPYFKFLVTKMLLLGFLMLLGIFEANTTLNDATLFKLFQLDRYGWSSWIWNSHRLCTGSVWYAQHFGCEESNKVISFISDKTANIFERIYFMVIERLVISLITNYGYAVCAVCRATSVRHLTPRLLSNRFTPCSHFFRPKVLGFHFCGASRVVAHFSVTHFPEGPFRGASWWFQTWPRHPVTANHHLGRTPSEIILRTSVKS